jgi:hypothetical protein
MTDEGVPFEELDDAGAFTPDPITIQCPACGLVGEVPGAWTGLKISCKDCGERSVVSREDGESE